MKIYLSKIKRDNIFSLKKAEKGKKKKKDFGMLSERQHIQCCQIKNPDKNYIIVSQLTSLTC